MALSHETEPRRSIYPRVVAGVDLDTPAAKSGFDLPLGEAIPAAIADLERSRGEAEAKRQERRAKRHSGEFSRSFDKDSLDKMAKELASKSPLSVVPLPESECLPVPKLKESVLSLAKIYENAGVQETDQIRMGLRIKEQHEHKKVGENFAAFVSGIASALLK